MTDVELVATLKAAAEKATPSEWAVVSQERKFQVVSGEYTDDKGWHRFGRLVCSVNRGFGKEFAKENADYISAASPENILRLIALLNSYFCSPNLEDK